MKWAEYVPGMRNSKGVYRVLVGNPKERNHLVEPRADGRILRWIFRKWDTRVWTVSMWLCTGAGGGHL